MEKEQEFSFDFQGFFEQINGREELILNALGFDVGYNGDIKCACPIHGGDNQSGFSYNSKLKVWKCWTHKCHEEYGSSIIGLVRGVKNIGFWDAVKFIEELLDFTTNKAAITDVYRNSYVREKMIEVAPEEKIYDIGLLDKVSHKVDYFLGRGFNQKTLNKYRAFFVNNPSKPLHNRAVAPILNIDGQLIGFTGRLAKEKLENTDIKWKHFPSKPHFHSGRHLYGLSNNLDKIRQLKTAILVEGPLDVWKLDEAGLDFAVATFGTQISQEQINLLLSSGVQNLIICYDPDTGGEKGTASVTKSCRLYFNLFVPDNKCLPKDPGELTIEEFGNLKDYIKNNIKGYAE